MLKLIASFIFLSFVATGCAVQDFGSPNVYERNQVQQVGNIYDATVLHVRPVTIQAHQSTLLPTLVSGAAGAFLGSRLGNGNGRILAGAAGGIGAALVAHHVADAGTRHNGLEIVVQIKGKDGRRLVVVQPDDQPFSPGDHVFLVTSSTGVRVTH
jgi:outer membrane lipoprotein SlyB